jgi:hypothetical protein
MGRRRVGGDVRGRQPVAHRLELHRHPLEVRCVVGLERLGVAQRQAHPQTLDDRREVRQRRRRRGVAELHQRLQAQPELAL